MKLVFRGAYSAALIVCLAGGFGAAWAPQPQTVTTNQQAPQPGAIAQVDQTTPQDEAAEGERVMIVGSILPGTPEDAPKPVEVFTREEMKEIGSPSVAEFIRDLSIAYDSDIGGLESSGDGTGETTGYAPANLRGLGDTATLTLLNGRRLSTDNGVGADLNTIPSNALAAVEVLRDGASTTYGAGAVGGVINLRTRRDINAPEITVRSQMYDKSAPEWEIEAATGWVGDAGNVMMAILNNAFANTSSSVIIAKVQGNSVDFLMPPLSPLELTIGFLSGAVTRGILVGIVTFAAIWVMQITPFQVANLLAVIYYAVVASLFMGAIGLIGGIWADKFDHMAAVQNFVVMPLTMLSGTFYPISRLGEPFHSISHANPFFHMIDGFRYGFTGHGEGNMAFGALYTLALTLALCWACWALFRSGYKLKA